MNDTMGKLPRITTRRHALKEVLSVATDKRGHVLLVDHCKWLELKLKAIAIIAKRGMRKST